MLAPSRFLLLLLAPLLLAACANQAPPRPSYTELSFAHLSPIKLDVAEVAVEQSYEPPGTAPNVEHLFPARPAAAAKAWARGRLVAAGPTGRARYIVRQASVVETPLETQGGLTGAVTIDQSERYDALIVVEIQIIAADGSTVGTATVEARRSRTVPENASLNERERAWYDMTKDLMADLDAQLDQTIKAVLFKYLII